MTPCLLAATCRLPTTELPHKPTALGPYVAVRQATTIKLAGALPARLRVGHSYRLPVLLSVPPAAQPPHSGTRGPPPTLLHTAFYRAGGWLSGASSVEALLKADVWYP